MTVDAAAVEAVNAEFYAAFEAGDIDRMRAVWDDADDVMCVHPGWPALRGAAHGLRSWALIMANTSYIQFFLTDVVTSGNGDIAVVTCAENIITSVTDSGGDALVVATNVFRRSGGAWRMWIHHGSPVLAGSRGGDADDPDGTDDG